MPKLYADVLRQRNTNLIYVGKATVSLNTRLVDQDLRHKRASTFFRGIGSVLGFTPPVGSLINAKNNNNYKFSKEDTGTIISWINTNLQISWEVLDVEKVELHEPIIISTLCPLFNTNHNPIALAELAELRDKCRKIALKR